MSSNISANHGVTKLISSEQAEKCQFGGTGFVALVAVLLFTGVVIFAVFIPITSTQDKKSRIQDALYSAVTQNLPLVTVGVSGQQVVSVPEATGALDRLAQSTALNASAGTGEVLRFCAALVEYIHQPSNVSGNVIPGEISVYAASPGCIDVLNTLSASSSKLTDFFQKVSNNAGLAAYGIVLHSEDYPGDPAFTALLPVASKGNQEVQVALAVVPAGGGGGQGGGSGGSGASTATPSPSPSPTVTLMPTATETPASAFTPVVVGVGTPSVSGTPISVGTISGTGGFQGGEYTPGAFEGRGDGEGR